MTITEHPVDDVYACRECGSMQVSVHHLLNQATCRDCQHVGTKDEFFKARNLWIPRRWKRRALWAFLGTIVGYLVVKVFVPGLIIMWHGLHTGGAR